MQSGSPTTMIRPLARQAIPPAAVGARRVLIVGRVVVCLITLGLMALVGRVVQLQTKPPQPIADLIGTQKGTLTLPGRRGSLLDRHGRIIATTHIAHRLFVDPKMIEDPGSFSEKVGYGLDFDPAWVEKTVSQNLQRRYVVLDQRLSDERYGKFLPLKLAGLATEPYLIRQYPLQSLAGQVVGFVGFEGKGLEGLELTLDRELNGTPGRITFVRDVRRRPIWIEDGSYVRPIDGQSVRLSFDVAIQEIAETELEKTCKERSSSGGQIIVMNPQTGEILAMASYPSFDVSQLATSTADQRRNRCVTDVYEPGSTYKPFVWAAALEQGLIRPNQMFDCTTSGAYRTPGGRLIHDVHGAGTVTADTILVKSSNIGMAQIGTRMGAAKLHAAVRSFGFGQPTGSGLPGEIGGLVTPLRLWNPVYTVTSVPMGQEVGVTALQMVRAFCAFANGGLLVTPTYRARTGPGAQEAGAPIYQRVLSPAVSEHTRQVLRRVVTDGTGKLAQSDLYEIFGKTGTAQVPDTKHGGYKPGHYTASFVCGAPVDNPQIVAVCVIHITDKKKGYYGGVVAAPAAKRVVEQTLLYMGVKPLTPDPEHKSKLVRADARDSHD